MPDSGQKSTSSDLEDLDRLFLAPSGWVSSKREQRPVSCDGTALPWFTFGAIEFLNQIIWAEASVFEYGAGYSTLWWQCVVNSVISVDHDPQWLLELQPKLQKHALVELVQENATVPEIAKPLISRFMARPRRTIWNYETAKVIRRGLEDEQFYGYAARILEYKKCFDFVVIDGMARRLCAEFAVNCVSEKGVIILDNSNRRDYDAAFDILNEAGFKQIPFWGLVPGANFLTCTSFFVRSLNVLPDGSHKPNTFDLPEY